MRILLLSFWLLSQCVAFAQTTSISLSDKKEQLQVKYKDLMKKIKKETGGFVILKVENDGYWYFHVYDKTDAIYDQQGNVIVPLGKYQEIEYRPALEEGFTVDHIQNDTLWHRKMAPAFLAQTFANKSKDSQTYWGLYRTDGTCMVDYQPQSTLRDIADAYILVTNKGKRGLYTRDGEMLLPVTCQFINLEQGIICTYKESSFYGAFALDKSLPAVPCKFMSVEYDADKKCWMVMDTHYHSKPYTEEMGRQMEKRSPGIDYFWAHSYNDVLTYFAGPGRQEPFAKLYAAAAFLEKTKDSYYSLSSFISIMESSKADSLYASSTILIPASGSDDDFQVLKAEFQLGKRLLSSYLKDHPESQQADLANQQAMPEYTVLKNAKDIASLADSYCNEIDQYQKKYALLRNKFMEALQAKELTGRDNAESIIYSQVAYSGKIGSRLVISDWVRTSMAPGLIAAYSLGVLSPLDSLEDLFTDESAQSF